MRPTRDVASDIRNGLRTIAECWDEVLTPPKGARSGYTRKPEGQEAPLPVSAHILDVRAQTCAQLAGWALMVIDERDLHPKLDGTDGSVLARFLLTHADWLGEHEAGEDACGEITGRAGDLDAIAHPKRREWVNIGPCPVLVDGIPCGVKVRAYPDREDITCTGCGTVAVRDWWRKQIVGHRPDLVTGADLADILMLDLRMDVQPDTIWQWVKRGKIERSGKDARGRSLYAWVDVVMALTKKDVA